MKEQEVQKQDVSLAIIATNNITGELHFNKDYKMQLSERFLEEKEDKKHNLNSHTKWLRTKILINHEEDSIAIINKWSICLVDYGMNVGSEINGIRPSIVLKNTRYKYGEDTIVVPITSYTEEDELLKSIDDLDILIEANEINGLSHRSLIKIRQLRAISKKRFRAHEKTGNIKILGNIQDEGMRKSINQTIAKMLGL